MFQVKTHGGNWQRKFFSRIMTWWSWFKHTTHMKDMRHWWGRALVKIEKFTWKHNQSKPLSSQQISLFSIHSANETSQILPLFCENQTKSTAFSLELRAMCFKVFSYAVMSLEIPQGPLECSKFSLKNDTIYSIAELRQPLFTILSKPLLHIYGLTVEEKKICLCYL